METKLKVTLLEHTPNPEKVIAAAAKLCYSHSDAATLYDGLDEEKTEKFLQRLTNLGHASPLEHAIFTFAIEGISRSCSHQLVRHRLASYSQQSQRYVKADNFDYIIPQSVAEDEDYKAYFIREMRDLNEAYKDFQRALQSRYERNGVPSNTAEKMANEDARYLLPNAAETKIVVSMNARELLHFFERRCCNRAQWEIRALADEMLKLCKEVAPTLFAKAGAPCCHGMCPEGKMSCGNPRREKVVLE